VVLRVSEIIIDCAEHGAVVDFWVAAMGYERHDENDQYVFLVPPDRGVAGRPVIGFQKVPEPKVVKNRIHLDLHAEVMADEVARLQGLGATFVAERSLGEIRWTVMEDPERNEFCVAGDR
jgi:hypothetical protein